MLTVDFEINGRRVRPGQLGSELKDDLERAVLQAFEEEIRRTVGGTTCAVHGKQPRIVCKGRNLDNLSIEVHGCCDELIKAIEARF